MKALQGLDCDIYISIGDLVRRRDPHLTIENEARKALWTGPLTSPTAFLFRQIASPSYETLWFIRKAKRLGFAPVIIEHRTDRFSVHNAYKRSLVTLPVAVGRSRHGRVIIRHQKLVEHNSAEGRPLETISTVTGEDLIDYHHRKLATVMGVDAPRVVDISDLVGNVAEGSGRYYVELFRILADCLVLFEDFVVDEQTASFFTRVVRPAYEQARQDTGRRPHVLRLTQGRRASSPLWNAYPPAVADDPSWASRVSAHALLAS